jgi:hypothetical protein
MVAGMDNKVSHPGSITAMIAAAGPLVTCAAMLALSGSAYLHETLLPWALLGVSMMWCPFLPTSVSAIVLGEHRDAIDPWVRGRRRFFPVMRGLLEGPARQIVLLNFSTWAVTAAIAASAFLL